MGDKQSRAAAASGGDASDASKETEVAPDDAAGGEWQAVAPLGEADGAEAGRLDPGSSSSSSTAVPEELVPSESEILARLVANLGQCPGRSLALARIRERLPPALRRLAEDTESICRWLQGFPGLFEVSGPPGAEQITLTVGKLPRPGGSAEAPSSAAGASRSSVGPGDMEAAGAEAGGEADAAVPGRASSPNDSTAPAPEERPGDEEGLSPSAVQLRGLPFRATVGDIKAFLGEHANHLAGDPAVRLLLNRDGRPSGFARVQLESPQAAQACREALHRQPMGDRYVEVLACSDRAGRARHRRTAEAGPEAAPAAGDGASEYLERERVLQECQEHMRMPGRNQLLLSMLGIALSPPARAYLRRANLGLKHFLARFPNEFRVEGPKGCERVIWCGAGAGLLPGEVLGAAAAPPGDFDFSGGWPGPALAREPSTPRPAAASGKAPLSHSGHCVRTPSDWGTPGPIPPQQTVVPEANAASSMDFSAFAAGGSWPAYNWPPPWAMAGQPWVPWPPEAGGGADGAVHKAPRGDALGGRQAAAPSGKRGARGEVSASRSHAHLHPQSHPFASRATGGTSSSTADGAAPCGPSADADGHGSAVPALRLRGLPFNVTVQDVLAFFAQHEVADRIADGPQAAQLLPKANGRPSGQAVVQMRSRYDAEVAQKALYHQFIGGRYIEVFVYGDENDSQGQDAAAHLGGPVGEGKGRGDAAAEWHSGAAPAAPWPLPPWAGAVAPPVPGGAAAGGQDGEAREGDAWGQIFNWLWHGHEQMPDLSVATALAGAPPGAAVAAGPAAPGALAQAHDAPPRATLQV